MDDFDLDPGIINSSKLFQFRVVALEENMHTAAQKLFVSVPALSKTIKQLETELNCELFERHNRTISLTEKGLLLLDKTERIYNIFQEIQSEFASLPDRNPVIYSFSAEFLEPFYYRFGSSDLGKYFVQNYIATPFTGMFKPILDGQADMLIHYDNDFVTSLPKIELDTEAYYLLVPSDDIFFLNLTEVSMEQLKGLPVICLQTQESWIQEFNQFYHTRFRLRGYFNYLSINRMLTNRKEYFLFGHPSGSTVPDIYGDSNRRIVKITDYTPRKICLWYHQRFEKDAKRLKSLFE